MPRLPLHLRRLFFSFTHSPSSSPLQTLTPHFQTTPTLTTPSFSSLHPPHLSLQNPTISFRNFTSVLPYEPSKVAAQAISAELLKSPDSQPNSDSLDRFLSQHYSNNPDILTPQFLTHILNRSSAAGRRVLDFHRWVSKQPGFEPTEQTLLPLIDFLGRKKDFKAAHELLLESKGLIGYETFRAFIDRLVRAGRPTQAISFFEKMEDDFALPRDRESLTILVSALCNHGFAGHAERLVKKVADSIFPDELICDLLVKGWCVDGKLDEARRLVEEISRGGFELGTFAYNSLLDCVCKLCRRKDPLKLMPEAEKILVEMDSMGVPRNVGTFNVLVSNLCKIRMTEEALGLFRRMGEWGCSPDGDTYVVLVRSLYQAARVGEGNEMLEEMKAAGFGGVLNTKTYYGFLKILCGIERVENALKVFDMMKGDGCKPGTKTYDLLMKKVCTHGMIEKANDLKVEAAERGVSLTQNVYEVDPRFVKKRKSKKKKPKRETLPEKMARKRKRLAKLRMSFVKKPKKRMRRAY